MSLQPEERNRIPTLSVMVAQAAFPKGNLYLRMRDEMGILFRDEQFIKLYPHRGQPAEAPRRLRSLDRWPGLRGHPSFAPDAVWMACSTVMIRPASQAA